VADLLGAVKLAALLAAFVSLENVVVFAIVPNLVDRSQPRRVTRGLRRCLCRMTAPA
jgi:hypothetical protein